MSGQKVCLITRMGWGFRYAPAKYFVGGNEPDPKGLVEVVTAYPPMAVYEHVKNVEGHVNRVILLLDFPKRASHKMKDVYRDSKEFYEDFERTLMDKTHMDSVEISDELEREIPPENVKYKIKGSTGDVGIVEKYYEDMSRDEREENIQLESLKNFIETLEKEGVDFTALTIPVDVARIGSLRIRESWERLYGSLRRELEEGGWKVYCDITLGLRVLAEPLYDVLKYLLSIGAIKRILMCYAFWSLRGYKATIVVVEDYEDVLDIARRISSEIMTFNVTFNSYTKFKEILRGISPSMESLGKIVGDIIDDLIVRDFLMFLVKVPKDLRDALDIIKREVNPEELNVCDLILLDIAETLNGLLGDEFEEHIECLREINRRLIGDYEKFVLPMFSGYSLKIFKDILKKIAQKSATYDFVIYANELFGISVFSLAYLKTITSCEGLSREEQMQLFYPGVARNSPLGPKHLGKISTAAHKGITEDLIKKILKGNLTDKDEKIIKERINGLLYAIKEIVETLRNAKEEERGRIIEEELVETAFNLEGDKNKKYLVKNTILRLFYEEKNSEFVKEIHDLMEELRMVRHVVAHGGFHAAGKIKDKIRKEPPEKCKEDLIERFDEVMDRIIDETIRIESKLLK